MYIRASTQGLPGIKGSLANLWPSGLGGGGRSLTPVARHRAAHYKHRPTRPWPGSSLPSTQRKALRPRPPAQGSQPPPARPCRALDTQRHDGRKGRGFILKRLRIYKRGHFILKRDRGILATREGGCGPPQAPARPLHPLPGQEGGLVTGDGGQARKEAEGKRFPQNSHLTLKEGRGGQTHSQNRK